MKGQREHWMKVTTLVVGARSGVLPRIDRPCMSHEAADGNFMIVLA